MAFVSMADLGQEDSRCDTLRQQLYRAQAEVRAGNDWPYAGQVLELQNALNMYCSKATVAPAPIPTVRAPKETSFFAAMKPPTTSAPSPFATAVTASGTVVAPPKSAGTSPTYAAPSPFASAIPRPGVAVSAPKAAGAPAGAPTQQVSSSQPWMNLFGEAVQGITQVGGAYLATQMPGTPVGGPQQQYAPQYAQPPAPAIPTAALVVGGLALAAVFGLGLVIVLKKG